jgi:CRP/FNR family transcriptional regulator
MESTQIALKSLRPVLPVTLTPLRTSSPRDSHAMTACAECSNRRHCLPHSMSLQEMAEISDLVYTRQRIAHHQSIYRAGDHLKSLYAVRSGFFKTYSLNDEGRAYVTGFYMAGDLIGMDGIETNRHSLHAVALEDSEVCVIHYTNLSQLIAKVPALQTQFLRMMSHEITHTQGVMKMGSMNAEGRIAAFLLDISERLKLRGYSASEFNLRMTREEIGSYLGLKLETVSRMFTKLEHKGVISVWQKNMKIKSLEKLTLLIESTTSECHPSAVA